MLERPAAAAVLTFLTALATPIAAHAQSSGFLLGEPSADSLGRAGAVLADTHDPAAVWLNPAALAFAPTDAAVSITATGFDAHTRFTPADGSAAIQGLSNHAIVPALFAHARLTPRVVGGIGFHVPYGFSSAWPDGWVGREQALSSRLYAAAFTAVAAIQLSDHWSIGLGGSALRGNVHLRTDLSPDVGGRADLNGTAWGLSAPPGALRWAGALLGHLALLWRPRPDILHLAAVYHARTVLDFSGNADFSPQNPAFSDLFADQPFRSRITLPEIVSLGVMLKPRPPITLTVDLGYVRWSRFNELRLDFERPGTADVSIQRGRRNPVSLRGGAQIALPSIVASLSPLLLRGGLAFDGTATAPEDLAPYAPDGQRLGFAGGLGTTYKRVTVDVGYLYRLFLPADARSPQLGSNAPPRGRYRTGIHALALTLTLR